MPQSISPQGKIEFSAVADLPKPVAVWAIELRGPCITAVRLGKHTYCNSGTNKDVKIVESAVQTTPMQ